MKSCHLVLTAAVFIIQPILAMAGPISLVNLPDVYVPGAALSFDVVLPPIGNLGAYNVDLVLTSPTGIAGTDFFFDADATVPSLSAYVFSDTANYFDAVNTDSTSVHRLSLTDFDFAGVAVVAGVNDRVARVVIGTTAGFNGELSLQVDTIGLILDAPDITPTSVVELEAIRSGTLALGSVVIVPVPEPSTVSLLLMASVAMFSTRYGRSSIGGRRFRPNGRFRPRTNYESVLDFGLLHWDQSDGDLDSRINDPPGGTIVKTELDPALTRVKRILTK